jgi:hypothetical protein
VAIVCLIAAALALIESMLLRHEARRLTAPRAAAQ